MNSIGPRKHFAILLIMAVCALLSICVVALGNVEHWEDAVPELMLFASIASSVILWWIARVSRQTNRSPWHDKDADQRTESARSPSGIPDSEPRSPPATNSDKSGLHADLKVTGKTRWLLCFVISCVVSFGMVLYSTLERIKISGPLYAEIITGKDLVADILPPPEYIIESYLCDAARSNPRRGRAPCTRTATITFAS